MTTSPYQAPSWDDADYVHLGQEPPDNPVDTGTDPQVDDDDLHDDAVGAADQADNDEAAPESDSTRSTEYATLPGLPGRGVVVVTALATAGVAGLDLALTGGLSIFFDLCFVVIGLVGAMAVRRYDLFTMGVLMPLVFAATIATVSFVAPETFTAGDGFSKAFLTGLSDHAGSLVAAYAVALVVVFGRAAATRRH